mgnify:CR=1 FL=1
MLLRLLSDTHLETGKLVHVPVMEKDSETVLILAGDIGYVKHIKSLVTELAPNFLAIVLVAGNHEYYEPSRDKEDIDSDLEHFFESIDNIYYLNNTSVVIEGVVFLGSTLWSNIDRVLSMQGLKHKLNDFRLIQTYDEEIENITRLTPAIATKWNQESIKYITDTLTRLEDKRVVVITHFSPSIKSMHCKYFGNILNPYFHNNLDYLMHEHKVTWVHGHTHASAEYEVGESKVYCNPWGYHDIYVENPEYNPYLTIEV